LALQWNNHDFFFEKNKNSNVHLDDEQLQYAASPNINNNVKQKLLMKFKEKNLQTVIQLAEKYFERVDATSVIELLPKKTSVANVLRYLTIVLEFKNSKKKNLQVRLSIIYFAVFKLFKNNNNNKIKQKDNTSIVASERSER
jgi:hypothetical protein